MKIILRGSKQVDHAISLLYQHRPDPQHPQLLTLEPYEPDPTAEMRGYWHVMLEKLADAVGVEKEKLKTTIKVAVLGLDEVADSTGRIYLQIPSSERQTRKTYARLIDYTLQFAADEFGVELPTPRWRE